MNGRREGRKEGGKEGRKGGRNEGRKEESKEDRISGSLPTDFGYLRGGWGDFWLTLGSLFVHEAGTGALQRYKWYLGGAEK